MIKIRGSFCEFSGLKVSEISLQLENKAVYHVCNIVSIRADALADRLRSSSSVDERADESSSVAEGTIVKNSLPTRRIDRRAPCNYVLFTLYHAPAASKTGRNENAKKKSTTRRYRTTLSLFTLHKGRLTWKKTIILVWLKKFSSVTENSSQNWNK